MVSRGRANKLWLGAILVPLCVCVAMLPVGVLLRSGSASGTGSFYLHSFTMGTVACPYSMIVGWNLGWGWTAVTNVVSCSQGSSPAAWMLLRWHNGKRTSLCVDFEGQRC